MKNKFSGQISIVISTILCGILSLLFSINHDNIPFGNAAIVIISLCCACIAAIVFAIKKIHIDQDNGTADQLLDLIYFLENYEVTEKTKEIYDLYVTLMNVGKSTSFKLRAKLNQLFKKRGYTGYTYELSLSDTIQSYHEVIGFGVVSFGWCCATACAIRLLITLRPISALFWIGLLLVATGYIYYAIFGDSERTNKPALWGCLISCVVIVSVCFSLGTIRANHVDSTCKDIHISIVEKCESDERSIYVDGYVTAFKIKVTNEKYKDVTQIKGDLNIYDANGNLLDSSIVTLSGDILSKDSTVFTLNIDRRSSEEVLTLYYATAKELSATFKISAISYDGHGRKEYPDSRLMKVLSLGENSENNNNEPTAEERYRSAIALYESGNFEEALTAFDLIRNYKDSAEYILLCEQALENEKLEAIYREAVSLFLSGHFSDAIGKFEAIIDYKDSQDYIEQCENAMLSQDIEEKYIQAKAMYQNKRYSDAYYAFYDIMDYKDSKDIMTAIIDEVEAMSIEYADSGNYKAAYELLSDMGYTTSEYDVNYLPILKAYNYAQRGDYKNAAKYGLTKIVLPAGITEIDDYMFEGCTEVLEIVMPDTVTSIGAYAFSGCKKLEKLVLSPNIESIGRSAFSNCDALDKLILPLSLKRIVTYGLNSIDGEIHYEGTVAQWAQVEKDSGGGTLGKTIHCSDGDVQP